MLTIQRRQTAKDIFGVITFIVAVIVGAWLINALVFRSFSVTGPSMETTMFTGDRLIVNRLPVTYDALQGNPYVPERSHVVVFRNPMFDAMRSDEFVVKRVIGLPGETVSFSGGYVYIDGEKLEEPYLPAQGQTRSDKTFTVPEGCIFVMGDNRESSYDSRFLAEPYISVKKIEARALVNIAVRKSCSWRGIHIIA